MARRKASSCVRLQEVLALDHHQHVVLAGGKAPVDLLVAAEFLGVGAEQLGERIVDLQLEDADAARGPSRWRRGRRRAREPCSATSPSLSSPNENTKLRCCSSALPMAPPSALLFGLLLSSGRCFVVPRKSAARLAESARCGRIVAFAALTVKGQRFCHFREGPCAPIWPYERAPFGPFQTPPARMTRSYASADCAEPPDTNAVRRRWRRQPGWPAAIVVACIALSRADLVAASPQQAPNSRVVLDLPAGYTPSPLFSGFQNDASGVSFIILEAPVAEYDKMAQGFTAEELAKRGITDVQKVDLARTDPHVYMRAHQKSAAGDLREFFVLFRTADQTILVSVNVPQRSIEDGSVKLGRHREGAR